MGSQFGAAVRALHIWEQRCASRSSHAFCEDRQYLMVVLFPQHALSGHANVKPFDPKVACKQECLITSFQDVYFVSESFEDAKEKMREFARTVKRPFGVKYNPYTQSIQVLRDTKSITSALNELRYDLDVVSDALARVSRWPSE